ncbi:MAG: chromosomal replication initiator protein DnaA [Campylobacterales bacterium]
MIFETVRQELKKVLPVTDYSRYVEPLAYAESESKSDLAILEAPNPYIASWVQTKYSARLADLFEIHTGVRPRIHLRLKSRAKGPNVTPIETVMKENRPARSTLLNPSYVFDSFVVGSSNQFAHTIAKAVAENPGKIYNPVFFYGGVGLGKTHLLQAIGNQLQSEGKVVIYSTIEQFINDFTYHLRNQTMDRFREKYRKCDLLMIDDVQFLSGKEETQKEFFHTFNELHAAGKQIVLTADKSPKQIAGLEDRLKSRFVWGQVADIQPPGLETKIAIIKKKCEIDMIVLEDEIVSYIATHMDENIREIEGTLIKLNAYSKMMNQTITMDFAKDVLKEHIKEKRENITLDEIIDVVAKELNCKPSEIRSKSRVARIVNARRMVIFLARKLTPNSMPLIAEYFGMKDHTAVSHAMRKIAQIMESDADFKVKIEELSNKIGARH